MADVVTAAKRSEMMAGIRSSGNRATELRLITLFREHGITGWRRKQKLPGNPDFVFRRERLCVFVDGCFWHGCPKHFKTPGTRREFWAGKIRRNKERDLEVNRELRKLGWRPLRIWEHDLRAGRQAATVRKLQMTIEAAVRRQGSGRAPSGRPDLSRCSGKAVAQLARSLRLGGGGWLRG